MSSFRSILQTIEKAARDNQTRSWRSAAMGIAAHVADRPAPAVPGGRDVRSAYAAHAARNIDRLDIDALRRAITDAGRDAGRLHQLRRTAARALHPDHGGDGAQLAECNALIDAALRTSRRRT